MAIFCSCCCQLQPDHQITLLSEWCPLKIQRGQTAKVEVKTRNQNRPIIRKRLFPRGNAPQSTVVLRNLIRSPVPNPSTVVLVSASASLCISFTIPTRTLSTMSFALRANGLRAARAGVVSRNSASYQSGFGQAKLHKRPVVDVFVLVPIEVDSARCPIYPDRCRQIPASPGDPIGKH